jgi:hypothetical protein
MQVKSPVFESVCQLTSEWFGFERKGVGVCANSKPLGVFILPEIFRYFHFVSDIFHPIFLANVFAVFFT